MAGDDSADEKNAHDNSAHDNDARDDYAAWLRRKHDALGITLALISPVVEDVCGNGEGLSQAQELVVGHSSVVFDVPRASGSVMVRAKVSGEPQYEAELWTRTQARAIGVPAPEILGLRHLPRGEQVLSVCVERKSPGRPLLEVFRELGPEHPRSIELTRRMGEVMGRLHGIEPDGFGPLDGSGRGRHSSYAEHVAEAVGAAAERLSDSSLPEADRRLVEAAAQTVLSAAGELNPPRPSVVHMDAGPDHCFVEGDEVVGLIDLEAVHGADPVYDFAWWSYWRDWSLQYPAIDHLLEGYGDEDLLRPETFARRLHLARLATGVTTLDYWVLSARPRESAQALTVLRKDATAEAAPVADGRTSPATRRAVSATPRRPRQH